MIAFDTNLLVRIAVNDDLKQAELAEQLLDSNEVFVPRTVLLETEWVLRSVYKKSRLNCSIFRKCFDDQNFVMENSIEVSYALEWYKLGADFADAMHLCVCGESVLHTFDTEFCKAAHNLHKTPAFKVL